MKKIYYDTMVFGEKQLEHLVNMWGADHVVIGTDYPYDMGYYKPVDFVNGARSLTRAQKDPDHRRQRGQPSWLKRGN